MILLFDIGNTNIHVGLGNKQRVTRQLDVSTNKWLDQTGRGDIRRFVRREQLEGVSVCSVVPAVTPALCAFAATEWGLDCLELGAHSLRGLGINYPRPQTIGPDRLANAVAAKHHFGAPVVVVDFGTAVTFDVVDAKGNYAGGIIAPGLSAMTDYLHEKTALLPRIRIKEIRTSIGKSTQEAMLIGAVHGYRGLIRELLSELKRELKARILPVVATGGYGRLIASKLPEISAIDPLLTLEGLRLTWFWSRGKNTIPGRGIP